MVERALDFVSRECFFSKQMAVKGLPAGASVVTPRLFYRDAAAAIEFCATTFGAVERVRRPGPDGTVAHALMIIGPAMIMIEAEWRGLSSRAPALDGSSPVVIYVYVEDVDKTVERAVAAGAKVLQPVETQFWGDRIGWIMDPSGHVWTKRWPRVMSTSSQCARRLFCCTAGRNESSRTASATSTYSIDTDSSGFPAGPTSMILVEFYEGLARRCVTLGWTSCPTWTDRRYESTFSRRGSTRASNGGTVERAT